MQPVKDCLHVFEKAKRGSGLEWITFRDFRHFRASQGVSRGIDLKTVQQLMGHTDIHATMRYAHFAPDHATRSIIESQRAEAAELSAAMVTPKVETYGRH
jgi:integrase